SVLVGLGLWLATWIFITVGLNLWRALKSGSGGFGARLARQSRSYYGMQLAHLGVAVFVVGVTLVKGYESERDVRMDVGDSLTQGGYRFVFKGAFELPGPNYAAQRGTIEVLKNERLIDTLHPEKRTYVASGQTMTEAAIEPGLWRDLYVALGEPLENGAWSVRVHIKPFVRWIWGGCALMALGGLLAVSDRRYRYPAVSRAGASMPSGAAQVEEILRT
ncbi:MAG: cytochrome c-type biogenesis CcmF C-terminal domain-containing protein, partial [Burkholderiales bacterium]